MSKYAFIDESGTMPKDQIMTVALIVVPGKHSASKIHNQIVAAIHPNLKSRSKVRFKQLYDQKRLHFADMSDAQKLLTGGTLSKMSLKAYIANSRHTSLCQEHSYRFKLYKTLIKSAVHAALADFDDLIINIGRQGGSEKYEGVLINELRTIAEYFNKKGLFKKAKFSLLSASNAGIQLADFYASASRDYFLSESASVSAIPYYRIIHQVVRLPEIQH